MPALGLDIGGTNLKALVCDDDGRVLGESTAPTGDDGSAAWRSNVTRLVRDLVARVSSCADLRLGIAAPGLPARDGRSIASMPARLAGIEGLDWKTYLAWPGDVVVLNDAHAALFGEHARGAARGAANAIMLTLGTGVGGAVVADGRLLLGRMGRAGALGHVTVDPAGKPDIVGMPGSLEDAIGDCTVAVRSGGRFNSTRDLVTAARAGDSHATEVWETAVRILAVTIAGLVNAFDPEVVVIGGGVAEAGDMLFVPLRAHLDEIEWRPLGIAVRVAKAELGSRAGAIGVAHYVLQNQS